MSRWFETYGLAQVADGLFVGAYPLDETDVAELVRVGIDRVLNLVEDAEYPDGSREVVVGALAQAGITEERLSTPDYGHLPAPVIDAVLATVSPWLDDGHSVYLHCRAGWQRSAALAAAVLATREGIELDEALAAIQFRKPSADPLPHQREDLARWWLATRRRAAGAAAVPRTGRPDVEPADGGAGTRRTPPPPPPPERSGR